MGLSIGHATFHLFLRIFLGSVLWSAAFSKLSHIRRFHNDIQEYQIIPFFIEKKLSLSLLLAFGIPGGEIIIGFGLISGILLVPSAMLAILLFCIFIAAIAFNLVRGRSDLACHCQGVLGNHRISWWLVGRNLLLIVMSSVLCIAVPDELTLTSFINDPGLLQETLLSTIVPVVLIVGAVLIILWLFNYARIVFRQRN